MNQEAQKKLEELQKLLDDKRQIEEKIGKLLSPEKEVITPSDFSLNDEILLLIKEAGEHGIQVLTLVRRLQQKFPSYAIERKKVASALAYLKNKKKKIDKLGHGIYKIQTAVQEQVPQNLEAV